MFFFFVREESRNPMFFSLEEKSAQEAMTLRYSLRIFSCVVVSLLAIYACVITNKYQKSRRRGSGALRLRISPKSDAPFKAGEKA